MKEVFIPAVVLVGQGLLGVRNVMEEAGLKVPMVPLMPSEEQREAWMGEMMKLNGFSKVTVVEEWNECDGRLFKFE